MTTNDPVPDRVVEEALDAFRHRPAHDICERCGASVYLCPVCSLTTDADVFHHDVTDEAIDACNRAGGPFVGAPS